MRNEMMSLRQWAERFSKGEFSSPDLETQCEAGWFDWFCKNSSLASKTKKLGNKLLPLLESPKIDVNTMYVFFKNNCPLHGSLYDSMSICDIRTRSVLYWIAPRSGHTPEKGMAAVYDLGEGIYVKGSWDDVTNFFLGNKS